MVFRRAKSGAKNPRHSRAQPRAKNPRATLPQKNRPSCQAEGALKNLICSDMVRGRRESVSWGDFCPR